MNRMDFQALVFGFSFIVREILFPLVSMTAAGFSVYFALRRSFARGGNSPIPPPIETPSIKPNAGSIPARDLLIDRDKFDEYHSQTLNQARTSFWFSIVFASVGFMVIAASIFVSNGGSTLGVISGVVTEAVSALFFYQSNRARQLMSDFFDSLRSDRKIYQSLQLCSQIEDRSC